MVDHLALYGGPPALPDGPPSWPPADDAVSAALRAALADGSWGRYLGPHCNQLVARLAELHETAYVWPCCSGTFAVELALRGLKVGKGDEVLLAGYDFGGNFRAIEAIGARPVLVDIDPNTWCLDSARLADAVSPQTRAILVSHLHGGLADMPSICAFATERGLFVVEDACQAHGAHVHGKIAGSWGDAGVLSFGGSKLLTAGRGGAVLTRHAEVHQRIKIFCERGNDAFPLSELQALVLLPQLDQLVPRNARRRENVLRLVPQSGVGGCLSPVELHPGQSDPSYYKLAWRYDSSACKGRSREQLVEALRAEGVAMDAGFAGFHRRSGRRCRHADSLEHSRRAAESTVILHHPALLQDAPYIDRVAAAIQKVLQAFSEEFAQ